MRDVTDQFAPHPVSFLQVVELLANLARHRHKCRIKATDFILPFSILVFSCRVTEDDRVGFGVKPRIRKVLHCGCKTSQASSHQAKHQQTNEESPDNQGRYRAKADFLNVTTTNTVGQRVVLLAAQYHVQIALQSPPEA